jgi:hypothetical protein
LDEGLHGGLLFHQLIEVLVVEQLLNLAGFELKLWQGGGLVC